MYTTILRLIAHFYVKGNTSVTVRANVWQARNEVMVLAALNHPNVVKYYECYAERGNRVQIVMELCDVSFLFFSLRLYVPHSMV